MIDIGLTALLEFTCPPHTNTKKKEVMSKKSFDKQ